MTWFGEMARLYPSHVYFYMPGWDFYFPLYMVFFDVKVWVLLVHALCFSPISYHFFLDNSYQKAIALFESHEAHRGLSFAEEMLANLNYQVSVSRCMNRQAGRLVANPKYLRPLATSWASWQCFLNVLGSVGAKFQNLSARILTRHSHHHATGISEKEREKNALKFKKKEEGKISWLRKKNEK